MTPLTTTFYTLSTLYTLLLALLTLSGLNLLRLPPAFSFLARTALSFTCLIACAIYGVLASLVLRCVGYGGLSQYTVARAFKWSMWAATGVTFVVEGEGRLRPPGGPRPAVFVGNHQTCVSLLSFWGDALGWLGGWGGEGATLRGWHAWEEDALGGARERKKHAWTGY